MHHVVDKIAKDAGMASFQCGVDENLVGSMFIHSHQHPIVDVLGEHVMNHDTCVTCHTRHTSVTDFRPKLGNPVEVTLMASPKLCQKIPEMN